MEHLQKIHRAYLDFQEGRQYLPVNDRFDGESKCIHELVKRGVLTKSGRKPGVYELTGKKYYPPIKKIIRSNPGILKSRILELKVSPSSLRNYISNGDVEVHNGRLYMAQVYVKDFGTNKLTKMFNDLLMTVRKGQLA